MATGFPRKAFRNFCGSWRASSGNSVRLAKMHGRLRGSRILKAEMKGSRRGRARVQANKWKPNKTKNKKTMKKIINVCIPYSFPSLLISKQIHRSIYTHWPFFSSSSIYNRTANHSFSSWSVIINLIQYLKSSQRVKFIYAKVMFYSPTTADSIKFSLLISSLHA